MSQASTSGPGAFTSPDTSVIGRGRCSGWTLIEMMIAIVVIGVIAGVAIAGWTSFDHKAKQRATMADMRMLSRAIESYVVDNGGLPGDGAGLTGLINAVRTYSKNGLSVQDHWGHPYFYIKDTAGNYSLESFGKDGVDGLDITRDYRSRFERDIVIYNGIFVASPE